MPSGQEHVPRLAPDAHGPGGGPGFLGARAVHGPDGAVGVFPPREPGRLDLPLPVAEHDGPVAVPFHGDDRPVRKHCLLTAAAQTSHGPVRMHDLRRAIGVVFFMPDAADLGGLVPLPSETKDEHRGGSRGDSVRTDVICTLAGEQDG